jgi:uncharacterized membrane protein YqjE
VSFLILVALALLVVGPSVGRVIAERFGLGAAFDVAWTVGRWLGAALLVMLVWACLYYFLPNIRRRFRWVTPGAIVGVLLWLAASRGFILYAENFASYEKTYGALGAVIAFLMWLWISSLALLVGGEVDDAIDEIRKQREPAGEVPAPKEAAYPLTPEVGRPKLEPEEDRTVEDHTRPHDVAIATRREVAIAPREGRLAQLVKRIGDDVGTLTKTHMELARTELRSGMRSALVDGAAIGLGGVVALIGLALLCVSAVVAAEPAVPALWLRLVLGAALYLLLGAALIWIFARRLRGEPLTLKRTRQEARRTARVLKEQVQHG